MVPGGFFETETGVLAFLGTTWTGDLPPSIHGVSAEDVKEEGVEGVALMGLMVGSRSAGVCGSCRSADQAVTLHHILNTHLC